MDARVGLREFLKAETFWIRNYLARELRSELHAAAFTLFMLGILNIAIALALGRRSHEGCLAIYTLISVPVGVFVVGVIASSMFRVPRDSSQAKFEDVSCSPKRLPADARELFQLMDCQTPAKLLFEDRTGSWVPSVFKDDSGSYAIVIPGGLAARRREERRALLAHEIAHVDQDDIELWLASDRISLGLRLASIAMLGLLVLSIVMAIVVGLGIFSHVYTYTRMLWSFSRLRSSVKTFQRYSETRADFAAVAYASGTALHSALASIANESSDEAADDDDHPPVKERLALIDGATRYWSGQVVGHAIFEQQRSGEGRPGAPQTRRVRLPSVGPPPLPRAAMHKDLSRVVR